MKTNLGLLSEDKKGKANFSFLPAHAVGHARSVEAV
jgi:hypothetical protein